MTFRLSPSYRYFGLAGMVVLEQGSTDTAMNLEATQNKLTVAPYYWNPVTLAFEVGRQGATASATAVTVTNPTTLVDANLTSAGSTKEVGYFRLAATTPGSSQDYLWTRSVGGTTAVDANLTSLGATREVGIVSLTTSTGIKGAVSLATAGTTATLGQFVLGGSTALIGLISSGTQTIGTVDLSSVGSTKLVGITANATSTAQFGSVALVSGTTGIMGAVQLASGTTNPYGSVVLASGSTAFLAGAVVIGAGSTANTAGSVALLAGSTANALGSVALLAGSSANTVGAIAQGAGNSTATGAWFVNQIPFSSANTSRTSVASSIDIAIVAASTRRALLLCNRSTVQAVACGLSTAAVTTALGNVDFFIPAGSQVVFGFGDLPNYGGPIRGITYSSTTAFATVSVVQFF
jgi:hypothetical protein